MLDIGTRRDIFQSIADLMSQGKLIVVCGHGLDFSLAEGVAASYLGEYFDRMIILDGPPCTIEVEGYGQVVFIDLQDEIIADLTSDELIRLGGPDLVIWLGESTEEDRAAYEAYILPPLLANPDSDVWVLNV